MLLFHQLKDATWQLQVGKKLIIPFVLARRALDDIKKSVSGEVLGYEMSEALCEAQEKRRDAALGHIASTFCRCLEAGDDPEQLFACIQRDLPQEAVNIYKKVIVLQHKWHASSE